MNSSEQYCPINNRNAVLYETISIPLFMERAKLGGIDTCCDIHTALPYLRGSKSVLDLGAGYGRAYQGLINNGYAGTYVTIERSKLFCRYLTEQFPVMQVINDDILTVNMTGKFDAIIWLWAGIHEFSMQSQSLIIAKASSWLAVGGVFIIDTMADELVPAEGSDVKISSHVLKVADNQYAWYGQITHAYQIENMARHAGCNIQRLNYFSDTGRARVLHILTRP